MLTLLRLCTVWVWYWGDACCASRPHTCSTGATAAAATAAGSAHHRCVHSLGPRAARKPVPTSDHCLQDIHCAEQTAYCQHDKAMWPLHPQGVSVLLYAREHLGLGATPLGSFVACLVCSTHALHRPATRQGLSAYALPVIRLSVSARWSFKPFNNLCGMLHCVFSHLFVHVLCRPDHFGRYP